MYVNLNMFLFGLLKLVILVKLYSTHGIINLCHKKEIY